VSVAHGFQNSATRVPKRATRVGPRETGLKSCFMVVRRRMPKSGIPQAADDYACGLNHETRRFLRLAGAVPVLSEPCLKWVSEDKGIPHVEFSWEDWYRLSIPAGETIADVRKRMESAEIYNSGPFWGIGRVLSGMGAGEDTRGRKIRGLLRERQTAVYANEPLPLELVLSIFGKGFRWADVPPAPDYASLETEDLITILASAGVRIPNGTEREGLERLIPLIAPDTWDMVQKREKGISRSGQGRCRVSLYARPEQSPCPALSWTGPCKNPSGRLSKGQYRPLRFPSDREERGI
jgi:hypothetical protein